jgi:hypothetical protein
MKQSINCHEFINAFDKLRPENFSRSALILMFEYFEQYERDIGVEIDFDPIAICCEYVEEDADDIILHHCLEEAIEGLNEEEIKEAIKEYIEESAIFIGITDNGTFVFQQF